MNLIQWIKTVTRKELRESVRDRRSLIHTMVTGPLMAPVVFALLIHVLVAREVSRAEQPLELPVVGAEHAPALMEALRQRNVVVQPAPADPEAAVREQRTDLVLRISPDYAERWQRGAPARVDLIFDASRRDSAGPVARTRAILEGYGRQVGGQRLMARGVPLTTTMPVLIGTQDQSTAQGQSSILFGMLPYFFILGGFVGGMALAIDATAGERERQSLQPLLGTPASRWGLVGGKWLATLTLACLSVVIGLMAFSLVAPTLPVDKLGMALDLGLPFAVAALASLVPLLALLAALQNAVSAFARNHREAQTYLSLLMFVPSLPSLMLAVVPVKTMGWMYTIPVVAQQVTLLGLLRGDPWSWAGWVVSSFITLGLAVLVLFLTVKRFRSERLVVG